LNDRLSIHGVPERVRSQIDAESRQKMMTQKEFVTPSIA
jgi:hypothetical protein